jgi:membrane protease YdiL (CAAX protease family)
MKGLLKGKKPGNQFLILISTALVSFFIIGLLGTVILANISGVNLVTMSDPSKWNANDDRFLMVIRGMQLVQFICLFVLPSFICAKLFSTNTSAYLGLVKPYNPWYFLVGAALLLFAIPLTNYLGELNRLVHFPAGIEKWMKTQEDEAARTLKILLSRRTIPDLLFNLFFIAGLAAIGEELLFRGMAQRILIRWFRSPWAGIIVTAVLFSAMHVQFYGFLPRFVLGILLGVLYWYSGSLWTAIIAHFVYDALLIILVYTDPSMLTDEATPQVKNLMVATLVSLAAIAGLMIWMKKNTRVVYPEVYADDAVPIKDHPF